MLLIFLKGLITGGSLIIAIGAQNAFVLSQGVRRQYVITIPLICAVCDAVLITLGVAGAGSFIASSRLLSFWAGIGGAVFLFCYGVAAFRSAFKGGQLAAETNGASSLKGAVLATLAVTLLNPHAYIDTILLLGSLAGQQPESQRLFFGAGAITASIAWFFSLSLGAGLLAPLFKQKIAWQILDTSVGVVMWSIGIGVLKGAATGF